MSANIQQQMAAAGQLMPQQGQPGRPNQAQLGTLVYRALMGNSLPIQGWQTAVPITERMGKTLNLITNIMLAMPSAEWQKAATYGLEYEKDAFHNSPDKNTYDQKMNAKNAEMFKKRQANEQNLQSTLSAQAAAAAQQQQQQQHQLLLNQQNAAMQAQMSRGMSQQGQQGFQHLQHPMQLSQMPQQPQQMGMMMGTPGGQRMPPNQAQFSMGGGQMRPAGVPPIDLGNLSPEDRVKVMEEAQRIAANTPDVQKQQIRMTMQSKMTPQQVHDFRAQNKDPLTWYFQQQAFINLQKQARARLMRQQGMPQNGPMQLPQQAQRPMNPGMMGGQNAFAMGDIINEQKAGYMAQDAGQLVVPASSGPARNPTPQMAGMPNMPNGANQTPRPPQMQPAFNQQAQLKMDQAAAQTQAQIRAQAAAKQLQGQPGGLGGPMPPSGSPAMATLNSAVPRPPIPMGQMDAQQMGQANQRFGQTLDPRFNQPRPQISMSGNINANINAMLAAMPVEQRQKFNGLPPEKLNELMSKWQEQQRAMQLNNAAQAAKNQPQMQGRPGQPTPGQFNPQNPGNQFGMPNGMPQVNGVVPPNVQQAFIQQQIARARMTAGQNPQQHQTMMDSMDIPPPVGQLFGGNLPMEIKKWRDLKVYLQQNAVPPQVKQQLAAIQQEQFRQILEKRNMVAQQGNLPMGVPQQAPGPMPGQPPNVPQQNMPNIPPHILQVTPQEIQALRQQHPRLQGASDDMIRKLAIKIKGENYLKSAQGKQNAANQAMASQPQQGSAPQAPAPMAQPEVTPTVKPAPNQAAAQKPQNSAPTANAEMVNAATGAKNNRPNQQNRSAPQPSPAAGQKSLKRPSPEDGDAATQNNVAMQRQVSQQAQRPPGQGPAMLTQEQLARLSPEQRAKYEQMLKARQLQMTPEDVNRLKMLAAEEERNQKQHPGIPMNPAERNDILEKLQRVGGELNKMGRAMGKWYAISRDDNRARIFFRQRLRLFSQFHDKDKMQNLKETLTMSSQEVDQVKAMIDSMTMELATAYGKQTRLPQNNVQGQGHPAGQNGPAVAQAPQPAPLSEANLVKNTQALNKMHQRTASKGGQPPAAPTSAEPPFSFGAASPHGQPAYMGKPAVRQEDLHLPPQRKKIKTGQQQTPSPAISAAAAPHGKQPSPEMKRQMAQEQKGPARPSFSCPDPDCAMATNGFPTEEALKAHIDDEHVKPSQDPVKYVQDSLAASLGLDAQGHTKSTQSSSQPMAGTVSKQGQALASKLESGTTPMSRTASLKGQATANGSKLAADSAKSTPGAMAASKAGNTPKFALVDNTSTPARTEPEMAAAMPVVPDPWADSTIDPQSLLASFGPFDAAAGGVIADMSIYRSLTPNDTPESSKDSGSSEPNSDISEGANLDIDLSLNWTPMDPLLIDMDSFNMEGGLADAGMTDLMMNDTLMQGITWDEISTDFNKPFTLDPSLYSMDTV